MQRLSEGQVMSEDVDIVYVCRGEANVGMREPHTGIDKEAVGCGAMGGICKACSGPIEFSRVYHSVDVEDFYEESE